MSNTIDTRVVEMKFDNAAFERGIASTLRSLANLQKGMQLKGATNGLNEINKAASKFSVSNIARGVETIASRFSTMGIVGVTALASIAHQAVATGAAMVKSLTTDPLKAGLAEYETNLNSIQTILANTGLEGKKGLLQVTGALDELNHYADQTIYNFSEMAKNIGTFTAAGIKLEPATAAIKGIANLAAISGSNAEQASSAMYQLSQAMAAGKATLVDWNSVVNAGMGGKVFQEALKETARVQGIAVDDIIKKNGSFRDSLQEGWLTTSVLTDTLAKFTGDLTAAQLKTMGYNDKQIAGIIKMGKVAQDAATKVKTVSQLINTLQEAASSGWAKTWQLVFGDFDEARVLFTNVNNVLGGFISASSDARNKVIKDWKDLGGRAALIEGIANVFKGLMSVLKPIKEAFREIFPPTTGAQLAALSKGFLAFSRGLKVGAETAENIKRTFAGFFAIFSIGISVLKGIGTLISTIFKQFSGGSGGILEFTGSIGDWLVALDKAIKTGTGFTKFFEGLGKAISVPIKALQRFAKFLGEIVSGVKEFSSAGAGQIAERFEPLGKLGSVISKAWSGIVGILKSVYNAFKPIGQAFQDFFGDLGETINNSFGNVDYSTVLDSINTGLLAGITGLLALFFKNGIGINFGGGFLESISESFGTLTGTMKAMQTQLKANALLKIAGAIALLTASVVALSMIDSKKLTTALTAMAVMFGQLMGSMLLFEMVISSGGFLKMPFATLTMIGLAVAINLLAVAVSRLAKLDWNGLAKGLTGVVVLIGAISGAAAIIGSTGKGMIGAGAGIVLLALGVKILVDAVQDLSGLNWEEIAKGLVGVAGLLGALALFTKFSVVSKGGIAQGAGLLLLAAGIKVLADAVEDMGKLSWGEIGRGLATMAGGLALMAGALYLIPPTSLFSAAAVFVVAKSLSTIGDAVKQMGSLSWSEIAKGLTTMGVALALIAGALYAMTAALPGAAALFVAAASLGLIANALNSMGGMSWGEIAKSLVLLAASLAILAAALYAMTAALPGAAALLVAAGALAVLAPVLVALGGMSWGSILKSLVMLAGALTILGVAGALLTPVVPTLLGLGAAIALLGVGLLAGGAGLLLFSTGLTALAVAGAAGTAALVNMIKQLAMLIPMVMTQLGLGLVAFAKVIATAGPQFVQAITVVLLALMSAINRTSPKIAQTMERMLVLLLGVLVRSIPKMVNAGMQIVIGVLNGISKNISKIVTVATTLIVNFINAISANLPRIIQSGVNLVLAFINGVANSIRANSSAMGAAGANLGTAIVEGMARGLAGGIGVITSKAREIASSALNAAKGALGIKSPSREFHKIGEQSVQGFANGLEKRKPVAVDASKKLAIGVQVGFVDAIESFQGKAVVKTRKVAIAMSKEFAAIGKYVNSGFAKGLDGNMADINNSFKTLKLQLIKFVNDSAKEVTSLENKLNKLQVARKKDVKAINETKAALALARKELAISLRTSNAVRKNMQDEQTALGKLANKYDLYTAKIKIAQETLANAIKTRDDYKKMISDQYSDLGTPEDDDTLATFIARGKKQVHDTKVFANILQRLRKLGLNDEAYKDLLAKGTSALPFVQNLLASGRTGVAEINKLEKELNTVGGQLGKVASHNLYQAGVQAAIGLVKGLQAQQKNIERQMDIIAAGLVRSIKRLLGIKSPSRVFAEIGKFTVQGLAKGLDQYSGLVTKSSKNLGNVAIQSIQKSISGISDVLLTDPNFNPVIRPVLDLTDLKNNASQIGKVISTQPLKVDSSLSKAKSVSAGYQANQVVQEPTDVRDVPGGINFTQINNSPKALSNAQIYRQTKNQLSVAKGALTP